MRNNDFKYGKELSSPKYLIICDGGNVRSAAIATTLKLNYGREAIAIGRLYMSPETLELLTDWADRIVIVQQHMIESIPERSHSKVIVEDIGQDRWGIYIHPELNSMSDSVAEHLIELEVSND